MVTYSWQKVLGGEAAHGMLILSPRAVERLETYTPPWPLPKLFRMTKKGKLIEGIFDGSTINTPSMLCVADYLDALGWVEGLGGAAAAIQKSEDNLSVFKRFVAEYEWVSFLAEDPETIANTGVCLNIDLSPEKTAALVNMLAEEGVAYDIASYRDAPSGLRIWCGATVEESDCEALLPWIVWARDALLSA